MNEAADAVARTKADPNRSMREDALVYEIERLRGLVRALHEPAWAELGMACGDIDDAFRDVLDRALDDGGKGAA